MVLHTQDLDECLNQLELNLLVTKNYCRKNLSPYFWKYIHLENNQI